MIRKKLIKPIKFEGLNKEILNEYSSKSPVEIVDNVIGLEQAFLDNLYQEVQEIKNTDVELDGRITQNETDITTLRNDQGTLGNQVNTNTNDIARLDVLTQQQGNLINNNTTSISAIQTDLQNTKSTIEGRIVYKSQKTNLTFNRQEKPKAISVNKYRVNISVGTIDDNVEGIVSVSMDTAPDQNNLWLNWYFNGTTLYLELYDMYSSQSSNLVENLKARKFTIWYVK